MVGKCKLLENAANVDECLAECAAMSVDACDAVDVYRLVHEAPVYKAFRNELNLPDDASCKFSSPPKDSFACFAVKHFDAETVHIWCFILYINNSDSFVLFIPFEILFSSRLFPISKTRRSTARATCACRYLAIKHRNRSARWPSTACFVTRVCRATMPKRSRNTSICRIGRRWMRVARRAAIKYVVFKSIKNKAFYS